jgi:hypothetical protein
VRRAALLLALVACGRKPSPGTTTLVLRVTDGPTPVGARVLLLDAKGEPVHFGRLDTYGMRQDTTACQLAPSVVGSWDGIILADGTGEVPIGGAGCATIPYGRYHVWAWRGIEYELWQGDVDLTAKRGKVELDIPLERAWSPHGTLSADLHVHAFASHDSRLPNPQRVVAQAAAGIQVVGLSDHDVSGDLDREIAALHLDDRIASIASNELSSDQLHVGVYPAGQPPPEAEVLHADAEHVFALARAMPGNPVVQLNHPRFRVTALYDQRKWDGTSWPPPFPLAFDAVEVLAGYTAFNAPGDRRFDDSVRDFYTFVDHGHLITPLGNSDTHDLNWVLDGTTRNYVFVDDPRTNPFDEAQFVAAIRARRVVATSGPWLDVEVAPAAGVTPTVGPGEAVVPRDHSVWVDITVAQTQFVHTERIKITVGGRGVQTIDVPPDVRTHRWAGKVEVGDADTWIGITADGDTPLPLALTGSYQKDKWNRGGVTPFAIASPILVDADGDGHWKRGDADLAVSYGK